MYLSSPPTHLTREDPIWYWGYWQALYSLGLIKEEGKELVREYREECTHPPSSSLACVS